VASELLDPKLELDVIQLHPVEHLTCYLLHPVEHLTCCLLALPQIELSAEAVLERALQNYIGDLQLASAVGRNKDEVQKWMILL
jgi:hypothetical protein